MNEPLFNYPSESLAARGIQSVVLTEAGAAFYNKEYGVTHLSHSLRIGYVYATATGVEVMGVDGTRLGCAKVKWEAVTSLLRLYLAQVNLKQELQ